MQRERALSLTIQVLYVVFLTSLVCTFRAVSSMSIGLILLTGIIKNKSGLRTFFHLNLKNSFLAGCFLLFLIHLIALLYTQNINEGWNDIRLSSGLLFIPLAVCFTNDITNEIKEKLLIYYCLIVSAASLYCLVRALTHYFHSGDLSSLFYHSLVRPLKHHAVYYSILVFIGLAFLLEILAKNIAPVKRYFYTSIVIFLSGFLFLLSSKLVLAFYTLYLVYFFVRLVKGRPVNRALITGLLILFVLLGWLTLATTNPVSKRFYDITKGNISIVSQEKFDPGMYFNGVQFRLLQWKFTGEILNETNSWLTGVSPGDARYFLDQKYLSTKMYTGDPARGDTGFLGYNTHNQFLQTFLEIGIAGLAVLCLICITLARTARKKKRILLNSVIILLLAWFFTESVLETQTGIMIFTFFPLFLSFGENEGSGH
ncbi:MAG TPA: O-antigen ligase family protein [Chitinophagaceae bacterium]